MLLLLDDLQWCDQQTLQWLHYLLHFDRRAPLLLVATLRAEELSGQHPVQSLLTTLRREGQLSQITLEGLSVVETAALASQVAGRELDSEALSQLYQETAGNALFVLETVRMGLEEAKGQGQEGGAPGASALGGKPRSHQPSRP